MQEKEQLAELARALHAGGHRFRVRILLAARDFTRADRKVSPVELATATGIALSNVSYHVKILEKSGLLVSCGGRPVRGAYEHFYALSDHGFRVLAALEMLGWMERQDWTEPPVEALA